jgi:sugar/nucleoside kinase (ribokinase family)
MCAGSEGTLVSVCWMLHRDKKPQNQRILDLVPISGAHTGDGVFEQAAAPVQKVVDTTGAGDCFTAAFVVAILEGVHVRRALKFATAAAGLCIQVKGAMTSLPRRAEVDAFIDSF